MQSKNLLIGVGVLVLAIVGIRGYWMNAQNMPSEEVSVTTTMPVPGNNTPEMVVENISPVAFISSLKEFTMTAYYDATGKWFSLKEIAVRKGDTVRIKITNTKGMHDFVIDEMGIKKELPMNEEVVIEFTADKVGDFVYYCSMPGHREGGQWGTLKVTE